MSGKSFAQPPAEAGPFLAAAAEGRLLIQRCRECSESQFYPRLVCVSCGGGPVEWIEASGRGTVHSFTVIRSNRMPGWAEDLPYVVALVDLEEGARMMSNVVDCAPEAVTIGMPVEVVFRTEGDLTLPRFRPAGT